MAGNTEAKNTATLKAELSVNINHTVEAAVTELTVTKNGTYYPPSDIDGYNPVIVSIPSNAKTEQTKKITVSENGSKTVIPDSGKVLSKVTVNVNVPDTYTDGYEAGYEEGYEEGNNDGYDIGYGESQNSIRLQEKTANNNGYVTADEGYTGLSKVRVAVPSDAKPKQTKEIYIRENGTRQILADEGNVLSRVTVNTAVPDKYDEGYSSGYNGGYEKGYEEGSQGGYGEGYAQGRDEGYEAGYLESQQSIKLQEKTATENGEVTADSGYTGLSRVTVDVGDGAGYQQGYDEGYQKGYNEGYDIGAVDGEETGFMDGYSTAEREFVLQEKSVSSNGVVTADEGYKGLSKVNVNVPVSKEEQEKNVTVTGNGTIEILPDEGMVLSKVKVNVDVAPTVDVDVFKKLASGQKFSITPDDIYGVSDIGSYAFSNIAYIENVELPESVRAIDGYAFYSSGIKSIIFNEGLEDIREEVFSDCRSLRTVTFKGVPMSVDANVFVDCFNLTINVPWSEGEYDDESNGLGDIPWGASSATINYNYTGG